jgi:glycine/D-amino acid oxidase-like deaminating enzyme
MNDTSAFLPGFKTDPYWWDAAPRPRLEPEPLPPRAEVVIVGSGFTGLSAALTLARAGRQVAVIDSGPPGIGASSRNFGMIGRQLKHDFADLIERVGPERAKALYGVANDAFRYVVELVEREGIDCQMRQWGRFIAASTPRHYEAVARELEARQRHFGHEFAMLPRQRQHEEIGSARYFGGGIIPEHRMLHPGQFHLGLLARVQAAGARLVPDTRVTGMRRDGDRWEIRTSRGMLQADHLVVATNGYTGPVTPWLQRRVVPINAYLIATEPLPEATLARLLPRGRGYHDTSHDMECARISPDGSRLLFGALTGYRPQDMRTMGMRLRSRMIRLFPDLKNVRLSHAWTGACAGTFDFYPHKGEEGGMRYALGYCFGAGMPFGTWLGHNVALALLGRGGETAFDSQALPGRSFYWGRPWFVPFYVAWLRWRDRRDGVRPK